MLSSPIILYDYPQVAPESPGELFDATEIDEILALRTMTLTDDEKAEARATDRHAAAIIDRVDTLPPEILDRLHGAVRYLRKSTAKATGEPENVPWWDPGADASVSPETDSLQIAGVSVSKGSRVRLCPGQRRADAQDMFLEGRLATVEAVFSDVDGNSHVAVTLVDDLAADLHRWHGRFLYFSPDEIEPLAAESLTGASSVSEKTFSRKLGTCFEDRSRQAQHEQGIFPQKPASERTGNLYVATKLRRRSGRNLRRSASRRAVQLSFSVRLLEGVFRFIELGKKHRGKGGNKNGGFVTQGGAVGRGLSCDPDAYRTWLVI